VIIYDCSKTFCKNVADRLQRKRKWLFYYSCYHRM